MNLPPPLLTTSNSDNIVFAWVVVWGKDGYGQEENRQTQDRLAKGRDKVDDQGFFINDDREPPDKINTDKIHQLNTKKGKNKKTQINTGQDSIIHQNNDYFNEYGVPDS